MIFVKVNYLYIIKINSKFKYIFKKLFNNIFNDKYKDRLSLFQINCNNQYIIYIQVIRYLSYKNTIY